MQNARLSASQFLWKRLRVFLHPHAASSHKASIYLPEASRTPFRCLPRPLVSQAFAAFLLRPAFISSSFESFDHFHTREWPGFHSWFFFSPLSPLLSVSACEGCLVPSRPANCDCPLLAAARRVRPCGCLTCLLMNNHPRSKVRRLQKGRWCEHTAHGKRGLHGSRCFIQEVVLFWPKVRCEDPRAERRAVSF